MTETFADKKGAQYTGAEAIAKAIMTGACKGNAELVKISLALIGETWRDRTLDNVNSADIEDLQPLADMLKLDENE